MTCVAVCEICSLCWQLWMVALQPNRITTVIPALSLHESPSHYCLCENESTHQYMCNAHMSQLLCLPWPTVRQKQIACVPQNDYIVFKWLLELSKTKLTAPTHTIDCPHRPFLKVHFMKVMKSTLDTGHSLIQQHDNILML